MLYNFVFGELKIVKILSISIKKIFSLIYYLDIDIKELLC